MKLIKIVHKWLIAAVILFVCVLGALAQGETNKVEDITAQLKKLDPWIGEWTYVGVERKNPLEKEGPFSGKLSNKWVLNNSFVQSHWEETNPSGKLEGFEMHGWDPHAKRYTYHGYDSNGGTMTGTGFNHQNTWAGSYKMTDKEGKTVMVRSVSQFGENNETISVKWDLSLDEGKSWTPWLNFTMKKVK
jgi:hypothetical protein